MQERNQVPFLSQERNQIDANSQITTDANRLLLDRALPICAPDVSQLEVVDLMNPSGRCRARTDDLLVVSQLLYQLS